MIFIYENIYVKNKKLISEGQLDLPNKGFFIIKGKNGVGKSLFINYLFQHKKNEGKNVWLVDQTNDRLLTKETVFDNVWGERKGQYEDNKFDELINHKTNELSGGEKRYLCLLRGLLSEAEVLFIDEPTNELDTDTVKKVKNLLSIKKKEMLIIAITHDDRLEECVDGSIIIEDQKIKSEYAKNENIKFDFSISDEKNKQTKKYISRQFAFGYLSLITTMLMLSVVFFYCIKMQNIKNSLLEMLPNDEVYIYVPVSNYYIENKDRSLQIKYTELFDSEKSILDTIKELNKYDFYRGDIHFHLELKSSENYEVTNLEYYDTVSHENFTYKELNKTEKEMYKIVCCKVKLKDGYTFEQFVNDDNYKKLVTGNYYICSNYTIDIINKSMIFNAQKEALFIVCFLSMMILLFEIVYYMIYLSVKAKEIRIFRNTSCSNRIIENSIIKKLGRKKSIVSFILLILLMIVYFATKGVAEQLSLIWISSIAGIFIDYLLVQVIIKIRIKKIMDWRYRC